MVLARMASFERFGDILTASCDVFVHYHSEGRADKTRLMYLDRLILLLDNKCD